MTTTSAHSTRSARSRDGTTSEGNRGRIQGLRIIVRRLLLLSTQQSQAPRLGVLIFRDTFLEMARSPPKESPMRDCLDFPPANCIHVVLLRRRHSNHLSDEVLKIQTPKFEGSCPKTS